jgi:cell division protein ZapA
MDNSRVVKVEVHGQEYPIRSGLDPAYVAELASYVDAKMRVASRESTTGDTLKIAVLAALNIADECFRLQAADRERRDSLTSRAEELERMLDLALGLAPATQEPLAIRDAQLSPAAGSPLR